MIVKILNAKELIKLGYQFNSPSYYKRENGVYYSLNVKVINRITIVVNEANKYYPEYYPYLSTQLGHYFAEHQFKRLDSKLAKLLYDETLLR